MLAPVSDVRGLAFAGTRVYIQFAAIFTFFAVARSCVKKTMIVNCIHIEKILLISIMYYINMCILTIAEPAHDGAHVPFDVEEPVTVGACDTSAHAATLTNVHSILTVRTTLR